MTKEELLEKIDKEERWLIFEVERTSRDIGIAFSAIKKYVSDSVLEHSKSTEPCEDAISRQAAVDVASGYCHSANVAKELAKLPSVNPQPKTGHWIYMGGHFCSICDEQSVWKFNYCPNCGAKMEEQA